MKILMLSWEFPPKSVGGLAQHVYDLTMALAELGQEVHLVTSGSPGIPELEIMNGVRVYRVNPYQVSSPDFVTWVTQLNVAMIERCITLLQETGDMHLLHAHDWLVAYAARAIKHAYKIPMVATIHATEYGRNHGLHNDTQRHISDVEWWLGYEAWKVICCSYYMKEEVQRVFQIPNDKLRIIPNGVNVNDFEFNPNKGNRDVYAAPDEKIVFYVGRLVREKGVQVLLDAAPSILAQYPQVKFIIAGKGPHEESLRQQVQQMGIGNRVYFTGYVDNQTKNLLYHWASVAVFPSLYEPFGIVALEAMATRTPVVVSDTGGLGEIVRHGVDGLKCYPGSASSLADMVLWLLRDPNMAEKLQERAYHKVVNEFNWQEIAQNTLEVYQEVETEMKNTMWQANLRNNGLLNRFGKLWTKHG